MIFFGIAANVLWLIEIVRHSDSPHRSQHRLLPTFAPIHSSSSLSLSQIWFDMSGSCSKSLRFTLSFINSTAMPNSGNDFFNCINAASTLLCVFAQRAQVRPDSSTSLCQRMVSFFIFIHPDRRPH